MAYYRLYFLSEDDRITSVEELHCADDASAIARSKTRSRGGPMQLWNLGRHVADIAPLETPAVPLQSSSESSDAVHRRTELAMSDSSAAA